MSVYKKNSLLKQCKTFQVGQGKMCLTCSEKGKSFRSLDAVRKHMVDKGHCKIAFSGGDAIAEFADFYDYSSTYPEADGDQQENNHDVDMGKNSFN